jgi:hypothetical protein
MKLILNVIANVALLVIAMDFVKKTYQYTKHKHLLNFEQWGFLLTSIVMGGCAIANLILKSNPFFSEVFQNLSLVMFLFILLKTPKSIANILEDEQPKKYSA